MPTRGPKGSEGSLRGAAALVRRLERQLGCTAGEARIAPLRPVATSVVTVPDTAAPSGRLRVLAAGVPTPGGTGACVGPPLVVSAASSAAPDAGPDDAVVAVVPAGLRYDEAAARLRGLLEAGTRIGAVLVAGDEGVLVANRIPAGLPVVDQVDVDAAAACVTLAVEVRSPGHTLRLLADPVALGARLGLREDESADAAVVGRALADQTNAVVGLAAAATPLAGLAEPWVMTADGRLPLRVACPELPGWPVGTVRAFGMGQSSGAGRSSGIGQPSGAGPASGTGEVDDLFAVDLAAAAEAATARQGSTGRAVLVAALSRDREEPAAPVLAGLLGIPVHSPVSEPAAARLGALTTPGARDDAVVADLGAGTIDVIGPRSQCGRGGRGRPAHRGRGRDARHPAGHR